MSKEPIMKAVDPDLVDIGIINGKPVFLFRNGADLKIMHEIDDKENIYIPPPIEKIPWLLPRADEVLKRYNNGVDKDLFDDLVKYHKTISDLPDETYYTLLAAWDMHTYLTEHALYSPMIHFFAVPERGKSRTGKGMIYVAYRGIAVESLRDAYIVRMAQNFNASIFFDVMDIWKKAEKNNAEDILLHRYEKGARVPRVIHPERGPYKDTEYFSVFGPTIIASNVASNYILESRGILIPMLESNKVFYTDPNPEYALELKERLTAHRGKFSIQDLLNIDKPAKGRLGDILKPLYQIIQTFAPHRLGVNWSDISVLSNRGINWQDISKLSNIGINWLDVSTMSNRGINWTSIALLSNQGINWTDISTLSNRGINWQDISKLSNQGIRRKVRRKAALKAHQPICL